MMGLHALFIVIVLAGTESASTPSAKPSAAVADWARLRELLFSRQQPQEQSQAALTLVQSPTTEAEEIIRSGLRRHERQDVFQAIAAAIRFQRDTRFLDLLTAALGAEHAAIRQAASDTLSRLDNDSTARQLLALAEDGTAAKATRQAAVVTLGRCAQKSAAIALMSLLSTGSAELRQASAAALESLTGQPFGADVFRWQDWWERQKDLTDEEWLAGRTAYLADRARRLRDDLQHAEKQIVDLQRALYGKIPAADRVNHLRTLIASEYPPVREQAVAWIGEMLSEDGSDTKTLVGLLLTLSDDGADSVQRQAVLALEKVSDPKAFQRLLALLRSPNPIVRAAAARSLGRFRKGNANETVARNADAVAALEATLGDSSLTVVAEAAESLGTLGVPEASPILAGLLRHPSDQVRQAAARGLETLGTPAVLPQLIAALDDPIVTVRFSLVGAMGKIGVAAGLSEDHKAVLLQRLEKVLTRDGDPGVRSRAAAVLGEIGTAAELSILWPRVVATEDNRVQVKAWSAMIEILARSVNWNLVGRWDGVLAEQNQGARRVEMLTEIRNRWLKLDSAKPHLDLLTTALIQAQLSQRKWNLVMPLAREFARKAPTEADLKKSLRWLLTAGTQAVDDKQPQAAMELIKDLEPLLPRSDDLALEFEALRQRALKAQN